MSPPAEVVPGPSLADPPATLLVGFAHALRARGLPVSTGSVHGYLAALGEVDLGRRDRLYDVGRMTLCTAPDHLPIYDEVFRAWFDRPGASDDGPSVEVEHQPSATLRQGGEAAEGEDVEVPLLASDVEVLRRRDLAQLSDRERDEIAWMLARLSWHPETRRTRRRDPSRRSQLDREATLRRAIRDAGEITRLRRARPRRRHRRLVLLIDVSGSMREYAPAYLRFAHVAMRRSSAPTEVFALGTRLTRLTSQLADADPDTALPRAMARIEDWQGGTRLGDGVRAFLDGWGRHGTARGAVVAVLSDGWERGDPQLLGHEMERLARLAHRVVWANPRKSKEGYQPVVSGMAAALPHVDRFVDGSSFEALEALARSLGRAGVRT